MDPSARDVLYVLVLLQVATELLSSIGETLFMGSPFAVLVSLAKATGLLVAVGAVLRGRRWGMIVLFVAEGLSLTGVTLSVLLGFLPMIDRTITFAGLFTEIGLPAGVIALGIRLLLPPPREWAAIRPGAQPPADPPQVPA
jgi:hypothetical protein